MNIAICDDSIAFLQDFEHAILHHCTIAGWQVSCSTFSSSQSIMNSDLSQTDVLFLDVHMPGQNGIMTAQLLRQRYPELIIVFVTNLIDYAMDGYVVGAFRYLLKENLSTALLPCLSAIHAKLAESSGTIRVHAEDGYREILLRSILYLEGTPHRKVILHLVSGRTLECTGRLSDYESKLADKGFLRLQKSFLANITHIQSIRSYQAVLTSGETLKVSERNNSEICRKFAQWKG